MKLVSRLCRKSIRNVRMLFDSKVEYTVMDDNDFDLLQSDIHSLMCVILPACAVII